MNFGKFGSVGPFGSACAPFDPSGGGDLRRDMRLSLPLSQLEDRRRLLSQLDQAKRGLADAAALEEMDHTPAQAFDAVIGGAADAFDLSKEPASVVDRYDTARLVRPENIDKKWKNYNNYVDNAKSLGRLLLLARRLCERGCGFVTVTTNFVWDMHADVNNAPIAEGMRYMAPPLDHAVSAFVEDLAARGLSDDLARGVRRNGPDAEAEPARRPRPLGRPRPVVAGGRRSENGAGYRPIKPRRQSAVVGAGAHSEPAGDDHAHSL